MRVYISSHSLELAEELATHLKRDFTHIEITSTWHSENLPKLPLTEEREWQLRANKNFKQIDSSDFFILMGDERYPGGKFVEVGWAMKSGLVVIVSGRVENGMMCWADEFVKDYGGLVAALNSRS